MAGGALIGGVSSYKAAKKKGARGWKLAGATLAGAAIGSVGGGGAGTFRAVKVARAAYNARKGSQFVKGRAAHNAWTKAMKRVVPGGKYDKRLRGTKKARMQKVYSCRETLALQEVFIQKSSDFNLRNKLENRPKTGWHRENK
ncbi:hypothetical protein QNH23_09550 [Siminovitchia fortis]|uniref:hypothetical protein n=1 Tax=Siminovitchia fortis TaxID=254758 RepID=UPI0013E3354D|nr:hypothetical protein [Siminovitchia fortis]WHY83830.1 hypothetical protein QNH23_09550 [Siminovitchia fortis]